MRKLRHGAVLWLFVGFTLALRSQGTLEGFRLEVAPTFKAGAKVAYPEYLVYRGLNIYEMVNLAIELDETVASPE